MDAKTLRAALAAAVRVTVSTSLIGCGGNITSDDARGGPAIAGAASPPEREVDVKYPSASGGKAAQQPYEVAPAAGVAAGGVATGGVPTTAGGSGSGGDTAASEAGSAGSSVIDSCQPVEACMTVLEGVELQPGQALSNDELGCCRLVVSELQPLNLGSDAPLEVSECGERIEPRFGRTPVTMQCCQETSWPTIRSLACTPWGPPVPPELPRDALAAWEMAA